MKRRDNKPDRPLTVGKKWLLTLTALAVLLGGAGLLSLTPSFQISAEQYTVPSTTPDTTTPGTETKTPEKPEEFITISAKSGGNLVSGSQIVYKIGQGKDWPADTPFTMTDVVMKFQPKSGTSTIADLSEKAELTDDKSGYEVQFSEVLTRKRADDEAGATTLVFEVGEKQFTVPLTKDAVDKISADYQALSVADGAITVTDTKSAAETSGAKCDGLKQGLLVRWALCQVVTWITDTIGKWVGDVGGWMLTGIRHMADKKGNTLEDWVLTGWNVTRNLVDIIAVIGLILIAFANILHINLNTYAVKRMLPLLIGSVIAANLSFYAIKAMMMLNFGIAGSLIDGAGKGIGSLAETIAQLFTSVVLGIFSWGTGGGAAINAANDVMVAAYAALFGESVAPPVMLIAAILFLLAGLLIIIVGFLMYIQPGIVGILTVLAPVAIIIGAFPFGQSLFKKWLGFIVNWIFMFPVCLALFALINVLAVKSGTTSTTTVIFSLIGQIALLVVAVRVPFTMGGDIAKGWMAAGLFIGKQSSDMALQKSMTAQVKRSNIAKKAGIDLDEINKMKGLTAMQKQALINKRLKAAGVSWGDRASFFMGGKPARFLATVHPRTVGEGVRSAQESREKTIQGLMPTFSEGFRRVPGNQHAIFESELSSWEQKAETATDAKLLSELAAIQREAGYSDEEMKKVAEERATNSKGGYYGKADAGGTYSSRMNKEQLAKFMAIDAELQKRGREEALGEVASPLAVERNIRHGALRNATLRTLGMSHLYASEAGESGGVNEKLMQMLREDIGEQYGDQADNMWRRITNVSEQIKKRREFYERGGATPKDAILNRVSAGMGQEDMQHLIEQLAAAISAERLASGGALVSTEEDRQRDYANAEAAVRKRIDDLSKGEMPAGSEEQNEGGGLDARTVRAISSGGGAVVPVEITSPSELRVADAAVASALNRTARSITDTAKKEGVDQTSQEHLENAIQQARIAPEDFTQAITDQGFRTLEGSEVRLRPITETYLKRFVLMAGRGNNIPAEVSQQYYMKNLEGIMPYVSEVSGEILRGALRPSELGTIKTDIEQKLAVIRGGGTISEQAMGELRDDMARVSPGVSITPQTSVGSLLTTGNTVVAALERMQAPEVSKALEQKVNPDQVKEIIVKQAAQGLVRQTAVERIDVVASQQQKPATLRVAEIARQIGNYARNSDVSTYWSAASLAAKQIITTNAARQVIANGKGIDEATVRAALETQLRQIKSFGGVATTSPSGVGPGALRSVPEKPVAPAPRSAARPVPEAIAPITPPRTPAAPPVAQPIIPPAATIPPPTFTSPPESTPRTKPPTGQTPTTPPAAPTPPPPTTPPAGATPPEVPPAK